MKLYITRHGETEWNQLNKVLGRPDIPLNEKGLEQARVAGEGLADIPFDVIYCSPLSRAAETAEIIAAYQQRPVKCIKEDSLIEQSFGIFEGTKRDNETYQAEKHLYFKRFPEGESFLDVAARVYPFLAEIVKNSEHYENVLLVTHGGICRVINSYFKDMTNEEFTEFFMKNCQLLEYDI